MWNLLNSILPGLWRAFARRVLSPPYYQRAPQARIDELRQAETELSPPLRQFIPIIEHEIENLQLTQIVGIAGLTSPQLRRMLALKILIPDMLNVSLRQFEPLLVEAGAGTFTLNGKKWQAGRRQQRKAWVVSVFGAVTMFFGLTRVVHSNMDFRDILQAGSLGFLFLVSLTLFFLSPLISPPKREFSPVQRLLQEAHDEQNTRD